MAEALKADLDAAIDIIVKRLDSIDKLYPAQYELLQCLMGNENIFYTNSTNSGKTLPIVIYPDILKCLNRFGYNFPKEPKVLFVTALNSLKQSLVNNVKSLGLRAEAVTSENIEALLKSDTSVLFISPEVLKLSAVTRVLVQNRTSFVLKCVDEAHLGNVTLTLMTLNFKTGNRIIQIGNGIIQTGYGTISPKFQASDPQTSACHFTKELKIDS